VEANAENATMVGEATASVLAREVEAIWISPDLVSGQGRDVIVRKARLAKIPVFTSMPDDVHMDTLFDLGANYAAIGRQAGELAADVLDGRDPAQIPVENKTLVALHISRLALKGLRETWELPDSIVQRADVVVDETGRHARDAQAPAADRRTQENGKGSNSK